MNISMGKAVCLAALSAIISSAITFTVVKPHPPASIPSEKAATAAPPKPAPQSENVIDIEKAISERVLGDANAPITIIEYASMTCDHCAAFHNTALPEVKKALIDTGQAKLVLRDMPWDKFALKAAKIARCAPVDQYFQVVEKIFQNQPQWARSADPMRGLLDIGISFGLEENFLTACADNEALEAAVLKNMQEGQQSFKVTGTPAFIFMKEGVRQDNYPAFEEIFKKMDSHDHGH